MNALEKLADWVANSSRQHSEANLDRAVDSFIDTLAIAALHSSVTSLHFIDEAINNSTTRFMMDRVMVRPYIVDPGLDDLSPNAPNAIRINLHNGQQYEKIVAYSRGSPEKPLTRVQLFEKFWHCANFPNSDKQSMEDCFNHFAQAESVFPLVAQLNQLSA